MDEAWWRPRSPQYVPKTARACLRRSGSPSASRWRRTRHPQRSVRASTPRRVRAGRARTRAPARDARRRAPRQSHRRHGRRATRRDRDDMPPRRSALRRCAHRNDEDACGEEDDTRGGWTGARRRASPKCGAPQKAPPNHRVSYLQDDRPTATTRVRVTRGTIQHALGWIATRFARSILNIFATLDLVGPILVVNTGILQRKKYC